MADGPRFAGHPDQNVASRSSEETRETAADNGESHAFQNTKIENHSAWRYDLSTATAMNTSSSPSDSYELRRLAREDSLSLYCKLCDLEWEPSHQELANVETVVVRTAMGSNSGRT